MSLRWRAIVAFVLLFGALVKTAPNFFDLEGKSWWPTKGKLVYGLDIQGGVHLAMGVDIETVMKEKVTRTTRVLADLFKEKQITVKDIVVKDEKQNEIQVVLNSPADESRVREVVEENQRGFLQVISSNSNEVICKIYDTQVTEIKKQTLDQAISVIRNRIDEFGVAEPSITAQGSNRVLVQLPGIKDSSRAKDLINRTARLEFRIVSHEMGSTPEEHQRKLEELVQETEKAGNYALGKDALSYAAYIKKLNADLKGKLPANTIVAFEKLPAAKTMESGKQALLLRTDATVGGDLLEDANVTYGDMGQPEVAFRFGVEGSKRFGDLTEANIGKLLAIVLDEVVQSAPVINSKITSSGVITLGGRNQEDAFNEAKLISMVLRAGALPATLEQLEERTVGPTLGADAISKAKLAGYIAFGLIAAFMCLFYGAMGLVASIALACNVLTLLAVLTGLGATLTLPGVAGIILTLGVAVDANVIIFERIKEEYRKGSSMKLAVADGFSNAYSAIIDSNVVAAAIALILFYYGTGPVRGFAVTLIAGVATSMFTAVYLSKVLIDLLGERVGLKRA